MTATLDISQVSKSYGEGAATVLALQAVDLTSASDDAKLFRISTGEAGNGP